MIINKITEEKTEEELEINRKFDLKIKEIKKEQEGQIKDLERELKYL